MASIAQRAYLKDLTVSFRNLPLEMVGDLLNTTKSGVTKEDGFVTVTPEGYETRKVNMAYFDAETNSGPWKKAECRMAKETDEGLVIVDPEAVKEAKRSQLEERVLELETFERSEVESYLCPGKTRYIYRPKASSSLYGILQMFLVNNPHLVLMGRVNLGARSGEKIMMLTTGISGHLLAEELVYPEDVVDFEQATWPEVKPKVYEMAENIILETIEPFNMDEWRKESRARIAQLIITGGGPVEKVHATAPKSEEDDLEAMLLAITEKNRQNRGK